MRRLLPILLASLLLAGCGKETIDSGKVEDLIQENSANPSVIESISCPDDVEVERGNRFDCKVSISDGSEEAATVEQLDDDGSVRVVANRQTRLPRARRGVTIKAVNAERLITDNSPLGKPLSSVRCPDGVRLRRGAVFRCDVRAADGERASVEIVQYDALGNIRIARVRRR